MKTNNLERSTGIWIVTTVAVIFGLLTIKSGGSVLFIDGADRDAAGNYVPQVLWFNFIAGFFYLIAAIGLFFRKSWSAWLSVLICAATLLVFAFLGYHILNDGLYEERTLGAMILRSLVWAIISIFAYRKLIRQ